jgi:hypothetical protein
MSRHPSQYPNEKTGELEREGVRQRPGPNRCQADARNRAVGLGAHRDECLVREYVANVELDALVNLVGQLTFVTHQQIHIVL